MAVRAQIYQGLLWQQVIDERKLRAGERLPPLLMLVLYNGLMRWKAPTQIRKLIALSRDSVLWPWQPQVRYYLLDLGAFPGDELARRRSLAALLFRLERPVQAEELEGLAGEVSSWFRQHPNQERLRYLFAELIRQAYQVLGERPPASFNWLEMKMKSNIPKNIKRWVQHTLAVRRAEGMAQGMAQGMSQGMAQGMAKAKAEDLLQLLGAKFGALAPSLRTRIQKAKLATLERWFKRAVTASDLRSVFNSPR